MIEAEEVTSSSFVAPLLPPCRVCGDKASGFHYGANTCEACKGFFRRSLQRKEDYKCGTNGVCDVGSGNRSTCAYCRYQKCLSVGMSKSAIKTGRYTHEKKTRDIEEVKRLQQQQRMQLDGTLVQPMVENREQELERIIRQITAVHLQQTPHTPEFFEKLPEREREFLEQRELQQQMFGTLKPLPREEYMRIYQTTGIDVDGRREMIKHMIPCLEKAIKRFISFAKALPGFQDLAIEDQIALIKASYFEVWLISSYRAFNNEFKLYTHVCGFTLHVEQLSRLEDPDFLDATFAVANRIKKLRLSVDEECLLKGIMLLASGSRFETWVITTHGAFNTQAQLFTGKNGQTVDFSELTKLHEPQLIDKLFRIVHRLQQLQLTVEEVALVTAISIMSSDRCHLQQPQRVEQSQLLLVDALQLSLGRTHSGRSNMLARCLVLLSDLRGLKDLIVREQEVLALEWMDKVNVPEIMLEMWS